MKIAVITGASSGMGREFALRLDQQEQYDEIWVIARRLEQLEELRPLVRAVLRPISLDLCKEGSIAAYAALLKEYQQRLRFWSMPAGLGNFSFLMKFLCRNIMI